MNWRTFFDDLTGSNTATPAPDKPGKVMICFMNRYLEAIDDLKYKFQYDDQEFTGTTTATSYCFNIQPRTLDPIRVFVWSRKIKAFKALDDVIPVMGRTQLVRKIMSTAKVSGHTAPHPEKPIPAPRPTQPPPPPPPEPSPKQTQGVTHTSTKNEKGEPQIQVMRPVPGMVTLEQLRKIFTNPKQASNSYLQQVANEVNSDLAKYKLDTPIRKAHFFSQIKGETGQSMKPKKENWEYSPSTLQKFSSYYRNNPDEAKEDGYLKDKNGKICRHANQSAIGKKHFLKLNGNRADHPEDGSNFRGRGLLQITGHEKYFCFMIEYNNLWQGNRPNTIDNPDIIVEFPHSIRSAIWFWVKYKVFERADGGCRDIDVENVTKSVNGGKMGLSERKMAFISASKAFI
jgi:predicted chitinase